MLASVVFEGLEKQGRILWPSHLAAATGVQEILLAALLCIAQEQLPSMSSKLDFQKRPVNSQLVSRELESAPYRRKGDSLSVAREKAQLNEIQERQRQAIPLG
jgi:hypothetical protein